jgi:large subunit ribosomal protein L19
VPAGAGRRLTIENERARRGECGNKEGAMVAKAIAKIDAEGRKSEMPSFKVGDAVRVHVKIREGEKERVQVFAGTVIARDGGGSTETFTVRRTSFGVGIEKVFPVHSPYLERIEVERSSRVRRAKLYYLRDLTGKKARLREV